MPIELHESRSRTFHGTKRRIYHLLEEMGTSGDQIWPFASQPFMRSPGPLVVGKTEEWHLGIHGVLEQQHHVMTRIREEVSARMPRPDEIVALRLRPGVPVLDVWHTSIDQDGQPYELTRFVMRGDMTGLLYDVPVE